MKTLNDFIFLTFGTEVKAGEVQATADDVYKYEVVGSNKVYGYCPYYTHEDVVILAGSTNYNNAGVSAYFKHKIVVNDKVFVVQAKAGVLEKYVFYFLQSKKPQLQRMARGSLIVHLPREKVLNMAFNPPDLEQQKRVVQALDANQELSDLHAKRAVAGLELQKTVLVDCFD